MVSQEPSRIDPEQLARDMTSAVNDLTAHLIQRATRVEPDEVTSRPLYPGDPVHVGSEQHHDPGSSLPPRTSDDPSDTLVDDFDFIEGTGREIRSHRRPEDQNGGPSRRMIIAASAAGSTVAGVYLIWEGLRHLQ